MLRHDSQHLRLVVGLVVPSSPVNMAFKILPAEHFIADQFQIFHLVVIDADKDHTVPGQQISGQQQPGEHHGAPS